MIGHRLVEVTEGIDHVLHLPVVVVQVILDESLERGVKVEGTCLMIAEEPLLDGNPSLRGRAVALTDDVLYLDDDCADELGEDNPDHPLPGKGGGSDVCCDVVVECLLL
jgi:hypothetical protein